MYGKEIDRNPKKKSTSSGIEPESLLTIEECGGKCGINVMQCATITPRGLCLIFGIIFGSVVYDSSSRNLEELSVSKIWYCGGLWRTKTREERAAVH